MEADLYFAFVAATALLTLIPGPNVALIVGNSVAHGARAGLMTVAGTSCAMVPQLGLTLLGLSATLTVAADVFSWLRFLGVGYLVHLGIRQWHAKPTDLLATADAQTTDRASFARGFLVSLTNPKTLLFYGAFFPQFVRDGAQAQSQLSLLAATFLLIAILVDSGWAMLAARARPLLAGRAVLRNRVSGGMLIAAAVGLGLARKP